MEDESVADPSGWIVTCSLGRFLLLHHTEVRMMCMVGYAVWHGAHVFHHVKRPAPTSYLLTRFVLEVAGGAILVPILLHSIPTPLELDSFALAILLAFLVHRFVPMFRRILEVSEELKVALVILFETYRAFEVIEFTAAAQELIGTSDMFVFPFFGPIICGAIAGCGGEFLPFDKGLRLLDGGLTYEMATSLCGAAFYSLFVNTSLSRGIVDAEEKAHVVVAAFFVIYGLQQNVRISGMFRTPPRKASKKER